MVNYLINFSTDDLVVPGKAPFTINHGENDGPLSPFPTKQHTTLNLYGEGALRYGEGVNESLVHLLEHFADVNEPVNSTVGQIWYKADSRCLKVKTLTGPGRGTAAWKTIVDETNFGSLLSAFLGSATGGTTFLSSISQLTQNGLIVKVGTESKTISISSGNVTRVSVTNGDCQSTGNIVIDLPTTLGDAGSNRLTTVYANTFDGIATSARYADLAERYHADRKYSEGTLVMLGGKNEITEVKKIEDIPFGVISAQPGIRMNEGFGDGDDLHPFVALEGRVPVRVRGVVRKFDRLYASDFPGVAIPYKCYMSQKPIGVALENTPRDGENDAENLIMAVVKSLI